MSESRFTGFAAGIETFGVAKQLETATSNLNKACDRERGYFHQNREHYSKDGIFSFRDGCNSLSLKHKK